MAKLFDTVICTWWNYRFSFLTQYKQPQNKNLWDNLRQKYTATFIIKSNLNILPNFTSLPTLIFAYNLSTLKSNKIGSLKTF